MTETENAFADWLRRQRRQLDLTQAELAQRADCSVMTIRKLERAELRPSKQLAELLARALNIATAHQATVVAFARGTGPYPQLDSAPSPPSFPIHPIDLPLRQHNLEVPTTPLVGREAELADLQQLLARPDVRLVTILGAGGMGKTHLAQAFASHYHERSQAQVFFVALAALASVEELSTAIIGALGYPLQQDQRSPEQQLLDYLQPKQMLLLLDNFEHLLAGVGLVNAILRVAPGIKILVTSRERLLLSGETLYLLDSLTYPGAATTTNLLDYGAVKLFLQRTRHLRPTFELSTGDPAAIVRICQLVEGMPLGILLAAAWVDLLPLDAIADEISQSLDFLATELRDLPERHRSIRAVFVYSWQRLTEEERLVFQQLAVFRGGFTRQAAQQVAGASLSMLRTLVNQSLLQVEPNDRYTLHELLRQYAAAELTSTVQSAETFDRHCAYYLDLLAQFAGDLKGPHQTAVLAAIETDYENMRAAWAWAINHRYRDRMAQASESLGFYYEWRVRLREGEQAFGQAVTAFADATDNTEQLLLPQLLTWQATFSRFLGHRDQATQLLYDALKYIDGADRKDWATQRAAILYGLGLSAYEQSDRLASERLLTQSLTLYRACGDRWGEAKVLLSLEKVDRNLPALANPQQHRQAAERSNALVTESLAIFRQMGDQAKVAVALETLTTVLLTLGQPHEAQRTITESLTIHRQLATVNSSFIHALVDLGITQEYLGAYEQMHAQARQAFDLAEAVSDVDSLRRAAYLLSGAALVAQSYRDVEQCFQTEMRLLQAGQFKTGLTIMQLVNWGLANYQVGKLDLAQQHVTEALQAGQTIHAIRGVVHGLLLGALLLVKQGKVTMAVEIHALALCYPFVANSRWCEDVAGRELLTVAESLPTEVVEAARIRGQASDLWATVAALLVALEQV